MAQINLDGARPLYLQVADDLEAQIADGTIPRGGRVPSATQICDTYDVSRRTANEALRVLRDKGLVHGVVGRGTFVVEQDD
ncbi:GntR family transcriptional regulator [Actinomadura montaniterrae]|uniref:Winged helix-turn-helix transcriptional regulator n=1 Tax=Actinomadura montaniterrae TaxID=1803903 RepID=A0A6L3VG95_9ACTN|nr:winged helix-turn-helix domain-containing protein [Actinomadura montaniterrae]KAB2365750.1 winged helix-turn-helix transcriptional regulator [Actinomadura montaniterrae]